MVPMTMLPHPTLLTSLLLAPVVGRGNTGRWPPQATLGRLHVWDPHYPLENTSLFPSLKICLSKGLKVARRSSYK